MSKIFAISSTGKSEKSFLDLRFGKCENVIIYNRGSDQLRFLENPFRNTDHSGVQLVNFLKKEGVTTIITGEVGPLVSNLLEKENLQLVLLHEEKIKVEDIIERLKGQN
jgi:predicted Fe-Mo cluster-binding NifX family protein